MELKKAKKRFIEIANKTGIHGENLKQEPNMQERDELWDITRVFLNRIYILDEIDNLSEEEVKEYNDLCYWSISALHWNDSLENYTFDNGRHRRDTLTLALCLYARVNRDYKVYENIKENFVIPHAFGSILLWVCNEITTVGRDIYFEKFDLEFIKLANEQKKAFFIEYGYYNREDKELEQDKIEKIALEIYTTLNQKGDKNLPQFLLKYIRNDKGLLAEDLEKNTKYLESILSSSTTTKSQVKVSEGEPTKSAIHKFGFLLCSFATTTDNKFSKEEMAKVVEILKSTGADEKIGLEIFDWFNEEMGKVNWKFDDKAFKKVLLDCIQDVGNFLNQFDEKVAMDKKKLFINDLISVANSDGKILDKEIAFIEMLCVVIEIEIPDIKDDNKERRWGQSTVEEEKEDDSDKGYPAINVRVFKDENGEKDVETQKLVSQYMMNWQEETEEYNGRMGITARIPDFFQVINDSCPKFTKQEIENIKSYIEKYKVIPSVGFQDGGFVPEEFLDFTKQVWWLVPFVIWKEDTASWVFIDKNGFYASHPGDNSVTIIFAWDKIVEIDLEWQEDNLVVLTLETEEESLTFSEFVGEGMGSYLSVIESIYSVYEKTIEVSDHCWYHGAGGEGYQGFNSPKELLDEKIWQAVKPTNPAFFGYVPPKIEPKICPYLKTFSLINTECSVPPFDEWKLNEYIDMLLDSPSAKPLFWKNDDGIYLMFPTPGLLISADTDDEEEQNYLKFLASNVPNKHFDLGYTQSHKKEENSWYEKTYDILIANNFEPVDGKFDIGKVTVTTDKEIEIIAQVFLKRDGLEWSIEGEENNGEYIKYDSGISYQGEAKDGKIGKIPHGKGEMTVPDGPVITGKFKDGLTDGHAKMDFLDGEVYEGDFIENKKHGKGVYVWPNGNKYEGEYQKGEQHGDGIYTWSNGKSWQGEWENDKEDGNGVLNYTDGAIYEAYWLNGEIDGIEYEDGQRVYKYISSHKFIFEGVFTAENQRTTNGTITTPNGLEINLKDCEKYVDKDLTETYTAMKNTYKSHTFEYDDTNGILPFERVSEIFGDCTNEEELSYEMDRVYGIKINNHEGYVILQADDDEIKEALEKERDIESNVIIKSDNIEFIELLVEMLKLNNREDNGDQAAILECEKTSNELETEEYSEDVYYSEVVLESMWEQMEEWEFFDEPENYGELIIVTVPVDSPPNLNNWQFQLSLTNTIEDKIKFEKRTGLIADKERLPFALENEIVVMVYNEEWRSVTFFSKTKDDEDEEVIKEEIIEEKKEVNKEFWWDEINDYVISKIKQENESIDEYLGHLQILFIDEWDVEDEVEGAMRYHNKVTFEDLDKLEQWIGKEEVKKWKMDWESLSEEDMKNTHETALYISTEEGYEYLTHLTIDKENFIEQLEIEVTKKKPVKEVKEEASAKEEVSPKEDVDNIQSFRNFMKEKFPSLKLPKNKPYAGIDLKDGYSINFHVQKKAVVLSFRSVKTDPEKIMGILDEKGLNGKNIGDGHILNAQPGKRNPAIITMNIEITYSSEDELASDNLRENVRSYFEKFSEIFDFSNQS